MSQIILQNQDINAALNKFVGPNCRFENGLIKLTWTGGDLTLSDTSLTTKAMVNFQGLAVEATEASLDATGVKIQFHVKASDQGFS